MIVTQIKEFSQNRYRIYLEQEFAFVLYKGELRLYHLQEGMEIKQKDYEEIIHTILPKRAKLRAMNLLQKRAYTEMQLINKLQEGCYPEIIIEETISYVKSYGYVNDLQYAYDYINCYEDRKPRKRIEMELFEKGISKEIIAEAYMKWEEDGGKENELKIIHQLLEKKQYSHDCDKKEKKRIYEFLMRKGFSAEQIWEAMDLH